jgi:hypothetical protein
MTRLAWVALALCCFGCAGPRPLSVTVSDQDGRSVTVPAYDRGSPETAPNAPHWVVGTATEDRTIAHSGVAVNKGDRVCGFVKSNNPKEPVTFEQPCIALRSDSPRPDSDTRVMLLGPRMMVPIQ